MTTNNNRFPILRHKLVSDKTEENEQKQFEKQIFFLMVAIYCQKFHATKGNKTSAFGLDIPEDIQSWISNNKRIAAYQLCPECYLLIQKAFKHTDRCPHSTYKTFCHECPTPCYSKEELKKILPIMRYSGKNIVKKHPLYALRFVRNLIHHKRKTKKYLRKHGGVE